MSNLERLQTLRNIAADVLERRDGDLGFNKWDCGTYACLLGHYARQTPYRLFESVQPHGNGPVYARAALHFDITGRQAAALFKPTLLIHYKAGHPGQSAYKELSRRIRYLDRIIKKYTAVPQHERAVRATQLLLV